MSLGERHQITKLLDVYELEEAEFELQDEIYECSDDLYGLIDYLIEVAAAYAFSIKGSLEKHEEICAQMQVNEQEKLQIGMSEMWGEE